MRRVMAVSLLLLLTACGSDRDREQVVEETSFRAIGSCGDLEKQIEAQAIREMNAEIDALIESVGDEGNRGDASATAPASMPAPTDTSETAQDYTTTNTQEKGVDEPDFVKNDGSRIFVLQGQKLLALAAWPPESASLVSETVLEGEPTALLLQGNRLVVFSGVWLPQLGSPAGPRPLGAYPSIWPGQSNAVKVAVLDVAGSAPRVLDEQYLEGNLLSARRTDGAVRIATVASPRGPALLYWPQGDVRWSSPSAVRAAFEKVRARNAERIEATALADWLPRALVPGPGGALARVERDCSSFSGTNVPARLGFTTLSTLRLDGLETRHDTLLHATDQIYASPRALYLAAEHHWSDRRSETKVREDHTYLFQFDLGDPSRVRLVASGGVPGRVSSPFSMDEDAGNLRVATTRHTWLGWSLMSQTNNVYVLRPSSGRLARVGELTGLARDEELYSARFEGPRGFLVTFRRVDPLFTLDLADPGRPRVAGEIKIPGYSTYLHALDANHLLTVGRDVSDDGRFVGGLQLQIFDVTAFASPVVQHRAVLGGRWSSSEAEYDHKAFTYLPSRALLALPFSDWTPSRQRGFVSTLELLRVTAETGIVSLGAVDHADLLDGESERRGAGWVPQVRRSVMMEDFVYSISVGGMKVHDTRDLSHTVRSIAFPDAH